MQRGTGRTAEGRRTEQNRPGMIRNAAGFRRWSPGGTAVEGTWTAESSHETRRASRRLKERGVPAPERTGSLTRLCPRRGCAVGEEEDRARRKYASLKTQVEGGGAKTHVPTPCLGFLEWFSPGREGECRGSRRKGPHGVLSTLPDQGTATGDEGTAAAGTTASPEGGAVLRTPLGWESKAHWCSRAGQETAKRRRSDRSPVKLLFDSQPPLPADVSISYYAY